LPAPISLKMWYLSIVSCACSAVASACRAARGCCAGCPGGRYGVFCQVLRGPCARSVLRLRAFGAGAA